MNILEKMRRVIRRILGSDSELYRFGASLLDFIYIVKTDGFVTWRKIEKLKRKKRKGMLTQEINLKNLNYPILVRPGTKDLSTIVNNVVREEYGHFTPVQDPQWMIDAGAYIGDTSAYFLSKYPNLRVIAIEPNPKSFKMARDNLRPYGKRVTLMKKGLFSNEKNQYFSGDNTGASISTSGIEIECTTIPFLLRHYDIARLDILKIDIEGAEESIFSAKPESWLNLVGLMIIEIHGSKIESLISSVLKRNGFMMKRYRSVWYCWSKSNC